MEDGGHLHERRALFELFGVSEDDGVYVLIAGLILGGLTFTACCYCKVYDPLRNWCIKTYNRCCKKQPKAAARPPPEAEMTPEVKCTWVFTAAPLRPSRVPGGFGVAAIFVKT